MRRSTGEGLEGVRYLPLPSFLPNVSMCGSSCSCGGGPRCFLCKLVSFLVGLVLTAATLAAIGGAVRTHYVAGAFSYGTTDASLALLVLVFAITMWHKMMRKCCWCQKRGCGHGGGCNCGGSCNCGGACDCGSGSSSKATVTEPRPMTMPKAPVKKKGSM